jgi:Tfp pilus assembly protein PilN
MAILMIVTRNSVGVELGEKDLTIAILRSSFGKLQLGAVHHVAGFMTLAEDERQKALQALIKGNRIPSARVYLTLPKEQGIIRQIDLPVDLGKKLSDVVKIQVETLSPWPANEIYWDFAAETPKKGQKLVTVTIVIIPRQHLDAWIAFFKSVGLPLSGATLSSLACGHGIQALWKEAKPAIVLRREPSYTEGIFVNGSRIAALTSPSSETEIVPKSLIERLLSAAKLSSAEDARMILCGDLDAAGSVENPAIPVENAKPDSARDFGSIAAALLPLKESGFRANLVPPESRYRESQIRLIPAFVLAVLVVCIGGVLLAREPYQNSVYASRLESDIKKIAPQVREVADQEKELNQLAQRYRVLSTQIQNHDYVLETLIEIGRVLPPSAFLVSYGYQDGTVTISGFAPSASEIQNLLESSPVFKGVEFTTGVTRDNSAKDRFTLKMTLEGPK